MTPLDRINAILTSPRAAYLNGSIEYGEYREMTADTSDDWPKHPDGTNMTIGEMPEEDRKRIMREAAARYRARSDGSEAPMTDKILSGLIAAVAIMILFLLSAYLALTVWGIVE